MDNFAETPLWEIAAIRCDILNFFLNMRNKITQPLSKNCQLKDKELVIFLYKLQNECEIELPYEAMVPGIVRYTLPNEQPIIETFYVPEKFKLSNQVNKFNQLLKI